MATKVNMHEAKTHLSRLVERVSEGEDVIICNAGKPVARLSRFVAEPRTPGAWKGRIWVSPDFFDDDPELVDLFENGPIFPEETIQADPVQAAQP